jgi:hypothetical protein
MRVASLRFRRQAARLPRVQLAVRQMLVVVAIVAAFLAVRFENGRWEERRRRYEILSEVYSENPFRCGRASRTSSGWPGVTKSTKRMERVPTCLE